MESTSKPQLKAIKVEIAERLRPTCAHMSEDEFDTMVARMALIEWKHQNDATPTPANRLHSS